MADRVRHYRRLLARLGLVRRFARADDGAAAIEFAFVAIPFLMLVFAILELGLAFLVSMTLENALSNVDRSIRTGDLQGGANASDPEAFRQSVCNEIAWTGSTCMSALTLDVRVLPSFAETGNLPAPKAGATCFDPGGPRSIVLVRAYYNWPLMTPLLQDAVASSGGVRQVTYAAVFTNEPYSDVLVPIKCK